jgi:hypothetical protein
MIQSIDCEQGVDTGERVAILHRWATAIVASVSVSCLLLVFDSISCVGSTPRIRLGDLDCRCITLSLESHRHLRVSINESVMGESATIPLTCSFLIRFSATSHIVNPHILRRNPWWNASSLDLFASFSAQLLLP